MAAASAWPRAIARSAVKIDWPGAKPSTARMVSGCVRFVASKMELGNAEAGIGETALAAMLILSTAART